VGSAPPVRFRLEVHGAGDEFTQPDISRTGGPLFGSHFENVPRVGTWAAHGVCRDATAAFFPERGQRFDSAMALCHGCPVIEPCRAYGLAHSSLKGIFGGLTEDERRRVRAQARQAGQAIDDREAAAVFALLLKLLRYPVRTWGSVASAVERPPLDALCRDFTSRRHPSPPGAWDFLVTRHQPEWELWARLRTRDLPMARDRRRRPAPERPAPERPAPERPAPERPVPKRPVPASEPG
jgi:WhiB family redox-sensing transcriptional regulator